MTDLVAFVRARLGEEECGARFMMDREAREGLPRTDWLGVPFGERVLREVEAMRAIVDEHQPEWTDYIDADHDDRTSLDCKTCGAHGVPDNWPCPTVRALAAIWRDHPDYDPGWAP